MDRSWTRLPRNTPQYLRGLLYFLHFTTTHSAVNGRIICPCPRCKFKKWLATDEVRLHCLQKQFPATYTNWIFHGEKPGMTSAGVASGSSRAAVRVEADADDDPINEAVRDAFGVQEEDVGGGTSEPAFMRNEAARDFYSLMEEADHPLYTGSKNYSKLSFLIKMYHIKCLCGVSDKAMSMMLELIKDAFPNANIPTSFYEAKKMITKLGLNYKKIDACPNDCMLFRGEHADRDTCIRCHTPRYINTDEGLRRKKKKPVKILRYFPLKPRLQRLFMSSKTAKHMLWHEDEKNDDGKLRHPRDGEAWKAFDAEFPDFAADPRNVRLALATDGFNPFGNLSTSYSIWPVVLVPYNLPPWMCMKSSSFMLSMIIPGKKAPGNDIDVYLQPLIEELTELWNDGAETYDSHTKTLFTMRAALMWTISDFPGLGTLSGWNVHAAKACPCCNFECESVRLPYSKKWCFMGHRRFLDMSHRFRTQRNRFNGKTEVRGPPPALSGVDILEQQEEIVFEFGKDDDVAQPGKRTRASSSRPQQWRKRSIFFNLPYWKTNLLRHSLDVMHIEKNVCDNVLYTLLNEPGKTKDHLNARRDLQEMGVRPDAWPDQNDRFQPAKFTLTKQNKEIFLATLKKTQVPDGYSSNISRCVDLHGKKVSGLKSHDSHVIMQQLLPLALKETLPTDVSVVLVELCSFFRKLCSKALVVQELDELQEKIILTLCHLEMLFPPSFFTVMVHLTIHLVRETKLAGPVQYRWMYPIERYLGKLKSYVRNKAWPEGCIAEGYIGDEVLYFCSRYFDDDIETSFNRPSRVDDDPDILSSPTDLSIPRIGRPVGGAQHFRLSPTEKLQAHRHVLINCGEVEPYLQEFRRHLKYQLRIRTATSPELDRRVHREFPDWFHRRIQNDLREHTPDFKALANGPLDRARRFTAYNVNGFKFCTIARDQGLKTQNSGVYGSFGTRSYSSSSDTNMQYGGVSYYGKLLDVIELNYQGRFTVTLFKCLWVNTATSRGITTDELGITSINFSRPIHTGDSPDDEPYILASEARQVYYVENERNKDWHMVVHLKPRDLFDMGDNDGVPPDSEPLHPFPFDNFIPDGDAELAIVRISEDE